MLRSWVRAVTCFVVDLCVDGFALVSFAAPVLSIGFALAKAFDVPLAAIHQLSYAWALAPLTVWFFVAYVRRRAAKQRDAKVARLQEFYVMAAPLTSPSANPTNIPEFVAAVEAWANETADWIGNNLGRAARERFLDRSGHPPLTYGGNKELSDTRVAAGGWRKNLARLIEIDSWDEKQ
jgi:hypothetical protein